LQEWLFILLKNWFKSVQKTNWIIQKKLQTIKRLKIALKDKILKTASLQLMTVFKRVIFKGTFETLSDELNGKGFKNNCNWKGKLFNLEKDWKLFWKDKNKCKNQICRHNWLCKKHLFKK
jgi:hypothetical protein